MPGEIGVLHDPAVPRGHDVLGQGLGIFAHDDTKSLVTGDAEKPDVQARAHAYQRRNHHFSIYGSIPANNARNPELSPCLSFDLRQSL